MVVLLWPGRASAQSQPQQAPEAAPNWQQELPAGIAQQLQQLYGQLDLDAMGDDARQTVDNLLEGHLPNWAQDPWGYLLGLLTGQAGALLGGWAVLAVLILLGGIVLHSLPGEHLRPTVQKVCCGVCAAAALGWLAVLIQPAVQAADRTQTITAGGIPLLGVALAAGGRVTTAAAAQTLLSLWGGLLFNTCCSGLLPLSIAGAGLAAVYGLTGQPLLQKLCGMLSRCIRTAIGALCALFAACLAVAALPSAAADNLSVTAAKLAVGWLTVVGPIASQALTGALAGSHLLRTAIGSGGMLLLLGCCAGPAVGLWVGSLLLRLAGGLAGWSDGPIGPMLDTMAGHLTDVLICLLAPAAMSMLLLVAMGSMGG